MSQCWANQWLAGILQTKHRFDLWTSKGGHWGHVHIFRTTPTFASSYMNEYCLEVVSVRYDDHGISNCVRQYGYPRSDSYGPMRRTQMSGQWIDRDGELWCHAGSCFLATTLDNSDSRCLFGLNPQRISSAKLPRVWRPGWWWLKG